jgi:glutathione S-transferase
MLHHYLHHYELSPFSEKIRLMFGYCDAQWQSVISPAMPPRSIVDPLAGGYRRIPVMQLGADVFCDTKLIANELATAYNKPELAFETCGKDVADYSNHIDTTVFMAGVQTATPLHAIATVFKLLSPLQAIKFINDRIAVRKASSVKPLSRKSALKLIADHYADMESKLTENEFLFGNSPTIADFSAYHNLWFKNLSNGGKPLEGHQKVNAWFNRMSKFGHGQRTGATKKNAFESAKNQAPRNIPKNMLKAENIGEKVLIKPSDYAKDSVTGVLVGENQSRWILARDTTEFGALHVHFPKQGFEISLL